MSRIRNEATQAALACRAIRERLCLYLRYRGLARKVEVHAVGRVSDGVVVMRVWQVAGESRSATSGWKLMRVDEVEISRLSDAPSRAPRDGYNPADPAMAGGIIYSV